MGHIRIALWVSGSTGVTHFQPCSTCTTLAFAHYYLFHIHKLCFPAYLMEEMAVLLLLVVYSCLASHTVLQTLIGEHTSFWYHPKRSGHQLLSSGTSWKNLSKCTCRLVLNQGLLKIHLLFMIKILHCMGPCFI